MPNLTSVTLTAGVPTGGTGTVGTIDNVTGTAGSPSVPVLTVQGVASGTAQPISATSLPLPTGAATAAKQPALGTAGTPSTDVITIQGGGGGATPVPVSGPIVVSQSTNSSLKGQMQLMDTAGSNLASISAAGALKVDGGVAQASTTASQTGVLVQGAVTTASPTYTTAQTSPLSLDTTGALRVNVTAGGGSGGTSSTVGAAAPSVATAVGFTDGTNMALGKVRAASTGAAVATDPAIVVTLRDVNANVQSGAPITIVAQTPTATASGLLDSRVASAVSTNATSVKASAGQVYEIDVFNNATYAVFLKLYNKASAPTVGTDTPVRTITIPASGGYSRSFPMGYSFSTGIAYAITKLVADSDTTVIAANDLVGGIRYI